MPERPTLTVTGQQAVEQPLRVVERVLSGPSAHRGTGWRENVVVVPGGHRPGKPDQGERDRARARLPLAGSHRIVVLGCTVGAGQTMTTLMTGEILATLRGDPVAVLDLNPGSGSLTERARAVPAIASGPAAVPGQADGSEASGESRLEVITADLGSQPGQSDQAQSDRAQSDPAQSDQARSDSAQASPAQSSAGQPSAESCAESAARTAPVERNPGSSPELAGLEQETPWPSRAEQGDLAAGNPGRMLELVSARYPLTLADPAASAVPRVLAVADQLVLVVPASPDASSALAMTLEWLEAHGQDRLVSTAITILNGVSRATMRHVEQAEAVASGRCRAIIRVPWDDRLKNPAAGPDQTRLSAPGPQQQRTGTGPLSRATVHAYTALAGVLIAGLAEAPEPRTAPA